MGLRFCVSDELPGQDSAAAGFGNHTFKQDSRLRWLRKSVDLKEWDLLPKVSS